MNGRRLEPDAVPKPWHCPEKYRLKWWQDGCGVSGLISDVVETSWQVYMWASAWSWSTPLWDLLFVSLWHFWELRVTAWRGLDLSCWLQPWRTLSPVAGWECLPAHRNETVKGPSSRPCSFWQEVNVFPSFFYLEMRILMNLKDKFHQLLTFCRS